LVRAARNALPIMSARMGAASVAAAAAIPAISAIKRRAGRRTRGAQNTVTTVVQKSHSYSTVR
jgi:hypothetical protein